ncbi:NADP-dependent oxidoreductase domain-containing protein [Cadophora sp. MPI-SDFR-AT-0126]|nr:NADP-dependent oxidoreductase domain-containing protein [Leotiomycetes sp. MPI-SDFR-AT-0126]
MDFTIPALGFGLMGLSVGYGKAESDEPRFKVLDRAFELGETFWDSSDIYGDSEELVGKWFAKNPDKRKDIFLATKFAVVHMGDKPGPMIDSSPEYVKEACEKSLKRLGVDTIDLYYCHRVDGKTPIELTVQAMAELKKEGKVKYLGLSEISSKTLRRACKVAHIDAVQIEYSPFSTDIESPEIDLLKTCRELGVAIVAYSPLGRGMLTGVYKSTADFGEGDFPQGNDIFPIPGTKKIKYLEENLGALKLELSKEEEAEIRKLVDAAEVHGGRYPEAMKDQCFADTPALNA